MAGQRVQQPRITPLSLSKDECQCFICVMSCCTRLLKRMGHNIWIVFFYVIKLLKVTVFGKKNVFVCVFDNLRLTLNNYSCKSRGKDD